MRSLIFADLHSHNYQEFGTTEDGVNTRLRECTNTVGRILSSATEQKVDEIWFVGDLYQLKNHHHGQVLQLTMYEMSKLAEKFPIRIIPGHHDYTMWMTNPIMLNLLTEYINSIYVVEKPGWLTNAEVPLQIYMEPCTRKIKELSKRLEMLEPRENAVFLGHQDIKGAQYGKFTVENGLDADLLSKKFKWSFIGHCHQPGKFRENVISIGAPLQHTFSDAAKTNHDSSFDDHARRGWWIFDSDTNEVKFIQNKESPEFIDYVYDPEAEEKGFIPGDSERFDKDFYKITVLGKVELPERLKRLKWKRVTYEIKRDRQERSNISFSDKKEDLLEKYVNMRAPKHFDKESLIEMGRQYL